MKITHTLMQQFLFALGLFLGSLVAVAQPMLSSAHKPGSVLFYNLHTSSLSNAQQQNTRFNITNTGEASVIVHWFFVDSGTCTVADTFTCLTAKQTFSFLSSDYDPGVTGYAVAVAVNAQGNPRAFDFLIGTEYVKLASGHQANLPAEAMSVINPALIAVPVPNTGGTLVDLVFDDAGYERLPLELALNTIPSVLDNNDTLVVINRIGGNLGEQVSDIGMLGGLLYNDTERGFSFNLRTSGCQLRATLSDTFLRTAPPFSKVIGAGATGWMRLSTLEKVDNTPLGGTNDGRAILGAMINFNANAQASNRGFNQGHNLHRLTNAPFTRVRMPVLVPPGC